MTLLKKTKTAMPVAAIFIIIALGIAGFSFAHWEKYMWIDANVKTGVLCLEFTTPIDHKDKGVDWTCGLNFTNPDPMERTDKKDIGNTDITVIDKQHLAVLLNNTYPSYFEEISFHVHNCGTIPWSIVSANFSTPYGYTVIGAPGYFKLDLSGDGKADVEINYGDNFHTQVDPCTKIEISFWIHILQDAPQNTTMSFTVQLTAINWNEDPLIK
ncbi:MAG: hypothetical protein QXX51_07785 [Candidatus Bathyarchaeia archaeon]